MGGFEKILNFKIQCKKCGKCPSKRTIYRNDSWENGFCPTCFAHVSITETLKNKADTPGILFDGIIIKDYNPVDLYWHKLTSREVIINSEAYITKSRKCKP